MKKIIISIFTAIALSGCNDFIDLKPVDFPTGKSTQSSPLNSQ